ncbi:MAG: phosphotransferase [Candidatus Methylacidiphilaceae bacterium]
MMKVQVSDGVFEEKQLLPEQIDGRIGRIGGSHAGTKVASYLRKEAKGDGARKLKDEVRFLLQLPQELSEKFPKVARYYTSPTTVAMEQEFFAMPTLRKILCDGDASAEEGMEWLGRILDWLFSHAYNRESTTPPDDYLHHLHFLRSWARFSETMKKAPVFEKFILADRVSIQGKECFNAPALIQAIEGDVQAQRRLRPEKVSPFVHGDLHFDNILVDRDTGEFKLVDPRGYEYCDAWYDAGKLYHSARGKYDMIHRGEFQLDWNAEKQKRVEIDVKFEPTPGHEKYNQISENLEGLLSRHAPKEQDVAMLSLFNEAIHFISDMPFHLSRDGKEAKAAAIYATGVWHLNRLVKEYFPHLVSVAEGSREESVREKLQRGDQWKFQGNVAA